MKLQWEFVSQDDATLTERLSVQDGWLVRVLIMSQHDKVLELDMVFVPDAGHVWEIENDN